MLFQGKLVDAVLRSNEDDIQDFLRLGADPNYVNKVTKPDSIELAVGLELNVYKGVGVILLCFVML